MCLSQNVLKSLKLCQLQTYQTQVMYTIVSEMKFLLSIYKDHTTVRPALCMPFFRLVMLGTVTYFSLITRPSYAYATRKDLGNRAHPACLCLRIT